ncbi:uncharacterized protein LOC135196238 [Macrobrachium nipponense]|uniref:uncharacterized protein LOC135196238 n=1 Tax=Macrobrachium nipponense TaxID=159736 RepID=UPI0030C7F2EB
MRFWILFGVAFVDLVAPASSKKTEDDEDRMVVLDRGRYIFGTTSTTTYTSVVASTSTVYLSCLSATAATICEKRKRSARSNKTSRKEIALALADTELETSLDSSDVPEYASIPEEAGKQDSGDGKMAFTLWTTTKISTTVTVYYTNTATTVTMSFGCLAGGMILPTQNC